MLAAVPQRHVVEVADVEVAVELPVDHAQGVADERVGDPLRVVVRGHQTVERLDEVDTEGEPVAGLEHVGERAEERGALLLVEVPDRAAEEGDESRAAGREAVQMPVEVADDRLDLQTGIALAQRRGGVEQGRLTHVERDEPFDLAVRHEGIEQRRASCRSCRSRVRSPWWHR